MLSKGVFDFTPTEPLRLISWLLAEEHFGEHYKYDLPKYCKENGVRCFYLPETRTYLVFPDNFKEQ